MSTTQDQGPPKPPFHLRIGVVGHRRPRDLDAVEKGFETAFKLVLEAMARVRAEAHTREVPFADGEDAVTLICPLAEGADQAAFALWNSVAVPKGFAKRREVILPFERSVFDTIVADGKSKFSAGKPGVYAKQNGTIPELLAGEARVFEIADIEPDLTIYVSDPDLAGKTGEETAAIWAEKRKRDLRYAAVADIIVRQADILIAAWNGIGKTEPGGTSATIAIALREGVPVLWVCDLTGEVRLLAGDGFAGDPVTEAATRAQIAGVDRVAGRLEQVMLPPSAKGSEHADGPHGHAPSASKVGLKDYLDTPASSRTLFTPYKWMVWLAGADVKVAKPEARRQRLPEAVRAEAESDHARPPAWDRGRLPGLSLECDYVRQSVERAHLDDRRLFVPAVPEFAGALKAWGHADAAATRLGHMYRSYYVAIFLLGVVAVVTGLSALLLPSASKPTIVGWEVFVLVFGIILYHLARRCRIHQRWIDCRHVAEQFRPSFALAHMGLAGRRLLRPNAPWTAWWSQAHAGAAGLPVARLDGHALYGIATSLRVRVVRDQFDYHYANGIRMKRLHHSLEWATALLLAIAPLWGVQYLVGYLAKAHIGADWAVPLTILAGVLGAATVLALARGGVVIRLATAVSLAFVAGLAVASFGQYMPSLATVVMAGTPLAAGALAAIRFQGDFQRFGHRSEETALVLAELHEELVEFERSDHKKTFLELRDIALRLETVLLDDLQDWRFVYADRPPPEA